MRIDIEGLPIFNNRIEENKYWNKLRKKRRKNHAQFTFTKKLSGSFGRGR